MIQSYRIFKKINLLDIKYLYQLMNDMDNPLMKEIIMNRIKSCITKNEIKDSFNGGEYLQMLKKIKMLLELNCNYFLKMQEMLQKTNN